VRGVTKEIRSKVIGYTCENLAQLRDATLISVGYDTLCRSCELAALKVEHIDCGSGKILIPRSKADTAGDGRVAYLSPASIRLMRKWLAATALRTGPVFRSLHLQRLGAEPLSTSSIRRLVKRAASRVGIGEEIAQDLSGHSMRVGAAQDMMVQGFDALAIMQAGGWKSANVVLRYVENASTKELHERRWSALRAA
jgi:integrase